MSKNIKKGDKVEWKWGKNKASGTVTKKETKKTTIKSKGTTITRKGTSDNPAIAIKQSKGTRVLKKASEVKKKA